jgi:hypothetical protein
MRWTRGKSGRPRRSIWVSKPRTDIRPRRYNFFTNAAADALHNLIALSPTLKYLDLGLCAMTDLALAHVIGAVAHSRTLRFYFASSIWPQGQDPSSVHAAELHAAAKDCAEARLRENVGSSTGQSGDNSTPNECERWVMHDEETVRNVSSFYRRRAA